MMHPKRVRWNHKAALPISCIALTVVIVGAYLPVTHGVANLPATRESQSAVSLRDALAGLGISPKSLAAAGVTAAQASTVLADAQAYLTEHAESISVLASTQSDAVTRVDSLRSLVVSGRATRDDFSAFTQAKTALAEATSAIQSLNTQFFEASTHSLSATQVQTLRTIRSNDERDHPVQFLVISRLDSEWIALRDALSIEAECAKSETAVPADTQIILSSARADPAVTAAVLGLSNALAAIQSLWAALGS